MIFYTDYNSQFLELLFFNQDEQIMAVKSHFGLEYTNFLMGRYMFDQFREKMKHMPQSVLGPEIGDVMIKYAGSRYLLTDRIDPEAMMPFSKLTKETIGELYGEA
jgi:hypothetical protein